MNCPGIPEVGGGGKGFKCLIKEAVKSVLRIFSEHNKVCYFRLDRYYFKSIKPMTVTFKKMMFT